MPLSAKGLCEALMTTPASAPRWWTSVASPGVGITPAISTRAPPLVRPAVSAASSIGPRQARVAADHEQRVRAGLLRQHDRRRASDLHGELGREQLAGYAADAVSAEVRAHGETGPCARE